MLFDFWPANVVDYIDKIFHFILIFFARRLLYSAINIHGIGFTITGFTTSLMARQQSICFLAALGQRVTCIIT